MPDFELYIDDDRYSVPTLHLITATSIARAKVMAEQMWLSSKHHRGVDLRQAGEPIAMLGSLAPVAMTRRECGAATL